MKEINYEKRLDAPENIKEALMEIKRYIEGEQK